MNFTIQDLKSRVSSKMHGVNVDKVNDFYGLCFEAAGNFLLKIDPKETKRVTQIENALYDQVYDYVCPTDLKGDRVIDIFPQVDRWKGDKFNNTYDENFDLNKDNLDFTIKQNSGVKTLRISKYLIAGNVLNACDSLTQNGTWVAGGGATSLSLDTLNYVTSGGSLRFNLATSGSAGYIENSTMTAVDISSLEDVGALFVYVYIPSTSATTSVNLRWGSSSSDYWSSTVTTTQDNTSFITGWNLLRFDWSGASEIGTPVSSAIDYLRVTVNYNGTAMTAFRVDNITAKLGSIYNINYYSKYLFRNSSGTWIEKPTSDTDLINLDVESVNCYLYELCELVAQELSSDGQEVDVKFFRDKKLDSYSIYSQTYKSEAKKKRVPYYRTYNQRRR